MTIAAHTSDTLTRDALAVLQPTFAGTTTAPAWLPRQLRNGMTGVGLFGRNVVSLEQLAGLTAQLRQARPDVLVAIDEEGGDVTRLEVHGGSSFPGNHALGSVDDPELTRAVAAELGRRLAAVGVTLNWAPSADINTDPRNPVIGVRSFGDDPALVARHTVAYVTGLQSAGVAACVKHFPGHGNTSVDSHLALPRVDIDLDTLHSRELVPFKAAIAAGARSVMSAHILLPALDADRPGTLSPAVLTGLLRAPVSAGGLGFEGLIFSDAIEMRAVADTYGLDHGCVLAVAAGVDAVCVGGTPSDEAEVLRLRDALVRAVRAGELAEDRLHDAAERVRALARWTAEARRKARNDSGADGRAGGPAAGDIGLTAARRALRVTPGPGAGPYEPPAVAPYVAVLTPVANSAAGEDTPWGVGAELARLLPGTRTGTFARGDADRGGTDALAAHLLDAAGDRPLVVVVRDVHRHPWMAAALDALIAARPGATVVEMGVPHAPPVGGLHIATHGAARVCGRAAAEVITGQLPTQP
ncbi:glycoside hydrolase family 3 protein [Streptomyces sp. NBC_01803]|uniref:glycoside hydrolase family 3 protein n=1 Tax=Streptomyces sp. NBC_01803 TaxID=2975946 RepID=UPI002DDB4D4B|nr:glycoside hydrolase family 3 protein [Streptomyces sp. NBC_01803]WSA44337.1 glycoside hydrolase family 3 protein [Streptomyces sp. NBC_01803]